MNDSSSTPGRSAAQQRVRLLLPALAMALSLCSCISAPPVESDFVGPARASGLIPASVPTTAPATRPANFLSIPTTGPVRLSLLDAVLVALQQNRGLAVQKLTPPIDRTLEDIQRAAFDPKLTATAQAGKSSLPPTAGQRNGQTNYYDTASGQVELDQFFPTGTTVAATASANYLNVAPGNQAVYSPSVSLSVTQALLRGNDINANLAILHEAQLTTRISQYALRGFAADLVAQVEETYWNYALAQRQIQIVEASLQLAKDQLAQTRERIKVGSGAETDLPAAEAQIALRNEDMINARSVLETTRLGLLRLINLPGSNLWQRQIVLDDAPFVPQGTFDDIEAHAAVAMRLRPDLNEARLQLKSGELEVVRTRNGMLPQLNFFITLGKSGYASTFGPAIQDVGRGGGYNVLAGIQLADTIGERDTRAAYRGTVLTRQQLDESLENMGQLAQVDVRSAYVEVQRTREQIDATAASRKLQEEKLRSEQQKLRVGRSTTLQVAQVQDDLLTSQIAEVQAVVQYLNALIELYRQDGSLLQRLGIAAPGAQPQ